MEFVPMDCSYECIVALE